MGYQKLNGYFLIIFILLHHTQPYRVKRDHLRNQQQLKSQQISRSGFQLQNRSNPRLVQIQRARNALRRPFAYSGRNLNFRNHQLPAGPAGSVPRTRFAPSGQAIPQLRSSSNGILINAGNDGGYNHLQIAIDSNVEKNYFIIQQIFELITDASHMLHKTTMGKLFFKNVNILIPKSWGPSDSDPNANIPPTVQEAINRGKASKDGLTFHTYIETGHIRILSHLKGKNFDYYTNNYRRQFL